ncbi:MAG: transposase, partial [Deltaproteobacteria bacterium]|nr:transposase [Deltaproteobacteria bacterium]
ILVNYLVDHDLSTLFIGYDEGWKQGIGLGKRTNQNFVGIPFLTLVMMIEYKCALAGIRVIRQEEAYTSKCSFADDEDICKHKEYAGRRVKRGLFRTGAGKLINADVNGSLNILAKGLKTLGKSVKDLLSQAVRKSLIDHQIQACSAPLIVTVGRQSSIAM